MTATDIKKPDMSFTEDPDWLGQREELWKRFCEIQYDELRKSKLKVLKTYFFTGELESPKDHGRGSPGFLGSRIDTFPLRSPKGWDYVVYTFGGYDRSKLEMKKLLVNKVLESLTSRGWTLGEELALWDHFLPDLYQKIIHSPVATKRQQGVIEGELSSRSVIGKYFTGIRCVFEGFDDSSPKYLYRTGFLLSALQVINLNDIETEKHLDIMIHGLMDYCFTDQSNVLPENKEPLDNYIAKFKQGMETLEFDPIVKSMWEDVKREHS